MEFHVHNIVLQMAIPRYNQVITQVISIKIARYFLCIFGMVLGRKTKCSYYTLVKTHCAFYYYLISYVTNDHVDP